MSFLIILENVAKNIVLAGVKSVTVFDPEPVAVRDLGTQVRVSMLFRACRLLVYLRLVLPSP